MPYKVEKKAWACLNWFNTSMEVEHWPLAHIECKVRLFSLGAGRYNCCVPEKQPEELQGFAVSLFSLGKQKLRSELNAICEQNKGQQQMLLREDDTGKQEQMDMTQSKTIQHKCLHPLQ